MVNSSMFLNTLPPPPAGKTGWPWTTSEIFSDNPSVDSWPKISIITPNYNYVQFLEMTIRSVLLQGYPNLEYIIIDDGSTDGSADIIKKYAPWLTFWKIRFEQQGQTSALNEGFKMATGEIVNWLCSDDYLYPGALRSVAMHFRKDPQVDVVVGKSNIIHLKYNNQVWVFHPRAIDLIPVTVPFAQPSCFYRRSLLDRSAPLDESYDYLMALELWSYFKSKGVRWKVIEDCISAVHYSHTNKTCVGKEKILDEHERIYRSYVAEKISLIFWHRLLRLPLERFLARHHSLWMIVIGPIWLFWTLLLGIFYGFRRVWYLRWKWVFKCV